MTKSKTIFGFGGIWLILACLAVFEFAHGSQKLCGEQLKDAMDLMCPNGFNAYKTKRSSVLPEDDENDTNFAVSLDSWPYLTSMEANGLAKTRRRRHGITHECCAKPCSLFEIKSYCRQEPY